MSATSGIGISDKLEKVFASAADDTSVRFIKIHIENESLVPDEPIKSLGKTLEEELPALQSILKDDEPAYILAHLDEASSGWLAISYVPDTASVRSKMLYASTRSSLAKSLGSAHFSDTLFATSKDDLTTESYTAHLKHMAAPKPLSARERELEEAREAERKAESYQANRAPQQLHGETPGLSWADEAKDAVLKLEKDTEDRLLILAIDKTETLMLASSKQCKVDNVASSLPSAEASYAIYAWTPNASLPKRYIIFIYTCPSGSTLKSRMQYSLGVGTTHFSVKNLLANAGEALSVHRVETSEPDELTEEFFTSRIGLDKPSAVTAESGLDAATNQTSAKIGGSSEARFARPKGPGRKR